MALQEKKLKLADGVLTGAKRTPGGNKLTMQELTSLFSQSVENTYAKNIFGVDCSLKEYLVCSFIFEALYLAQFSPGRISSSV